jgi:septal ring factor EnvC (AmiA/AmiB activator)
MNRTEFVVAIAVILFAAFVLGWFAHWLVARMSRVTQADMTELESMASALHDAEEARDEAIAYVHYREQELQAQISQTEAELRAAMEGLRDARQEAAELRAYIEALKA